MTARPCPTLAALFFTLMAPLSAQSGWTQYVGSEPIARAWQGMASDRAHNSVVLFGGWNGAPLSDTWEWNGSTWLQRSTGSSPQARCCVGMAYDPGRDVVVLFGGTDGNSDLGDTWEWSAGSGWRPISTLNSPPARRLHQLAYDPVRGKVLLFGGGQTGLGMPVLNDTWEFDGNDWTQLTPVHAPDARWYHSMATDWIGQRIVLFGGTDTQATGGRNDLWVWDGTDWTQLGAPGGPVARHDASLAQDPLTGDMLLYGGWDGTQFFGDTWAWNGLTWHALGINPGPSARRGMGMAGDYGNGRVVAIGGFTNGYVRETWLHQGVVAAAYDAFGSGCAGSAGTPALSARAGQLPRIGRSLDVVVANLPAGAATVMLLGTSNTGWQQQTLPLDLGGIGMPGCSLFVSADLTFALANATGSATWTLPVPNNPFLIGYDFYNQAFVQDTPANALGVVASNAARGHIGS